MDEIAPYLSYDFERFSLSSRESFVTACVETQKYKLAGWPSLKLYYSAFFSAHAIMRALGTGVVSLSATETQRLDELLSIRDPSHTPLPPGTYQFDLAIQSTEQNKEKTVAISPVKSGKGVHDSFWKQFCYFLRDRAEEAVKRNAADSDNFIAGSSEIIDAITENGINSGVWFSRIRNEINYQHQHATWFPIQRSSKTVDVLSLVKTSNSATIGLQSKKPSDPIKPFVQVSMYMACLNIDLSSLIAARSTRGGAFGQKWRRFVEHV